VGMGLFPPKRGGNGARLKRFAQRRSRHEEERSDEATQESVAAPDPFAFGSQ